MKKLKLILLLSVLNVCNNNIAYSEETKTFESIYNIRTKINIDDVKSAKVANPEIAKIEIENGNLFITGKKKGSTILYIWDKENNVNIVVLSINEKQNYKSRIIKKEKLLQLPSSPNSGFYFVEGYTDPTLKTIGNNTLNQSFILNSEIDQDTKFSISSNLNNKISKNLSSFESFNIQNFNSNLTGKNFKIDLGSSFSDNKFISFNSFIPNSLNGLNIKHKLNKNIKYSIFSGFTQNKFTIFDNVSLYNNSFIEDFNKVSSGITSEFTKDEKDLSFFGSVFSLYDIKNNSNYLNATSGFSWIPNNDFNTEGFIGTSFNSLGSQLKTNFKYEWEKTNEYVNVNVLTRYFGDNYTTSNNKNISFLNSIRLNSKHRSGLNFSANISSNLSSEYLTYNNFNLRGSYDVIDNKLEVFSQILYSDMFRLKRKTFSVGANFDYYLPFSISYNNITNNFFFINSFDLNQLKILLKLFNQNDFKLSLLSNTFINQKIASTASQEIGLNAYFNINNDYLIRLMSSYQFTINGIKSNFLRNNLTLDYKISPYHNLSLSANYVNSFDSIYDNLSNYRLSYTYNFGMNYMDNSGNIVANLFDDENDNGVRDSNEKNISGIKLLIEEAKNIETSKDNKLLFKDLFFGTYYAKIDDKSIPKNYRTNIPLNFEILLDNNTKEINIPFTKNAIIRGTAFANSLMSMGLENVEIILDDKEKVLTSFNGSFLLKTLPGKHTLKIKPESIPNGFELNGQLFNDFEIDINGKEINFIFEPLINLKCTFYDSSTKKILSNKELIFKNLLNEDIEDINITTDKRGKVTLNNIKEGVWEVYNPDTDKSIEIEIPSKPSDLNMTLNI